MIGEIKRKRMHSLKSFQAVVAPVLLRCSAVLCYSELVSLAPQPKYVRGHACDIFCAMRTEAGP